MYYRRGIAWSVKKDYDRAIADYNKAIQLDPKHAEPSATAATPGLQEGLRQGDRRLQRGDPARSEIAVAFNNRGRHGHATRTTTRRLPITASRSGSMPKHAVAYRNRGVRLVCQGSTTKRFPITPRPSILIAKHAVAYAYRGDAWYAKKEYDKAIPDYSEAIRLDPRYALAYATCGRWSAKKAVRQGDGRLRRAIGMIPSRDSLRGRASLWATCPDAKYRDGKLAVESATTACELTEWKKPCSLNTLAAANAEAGDFDAAVTGRPRRMPLIPMPKTKRRAMRGSSSTRRESPFASPDEPSPAMNNAVCPRQRRADGRD